MTKDCLICFHRELFEDIIHNLDDAASGVSIMAEEEGLEPETVEARLARLTSVPGSDGYTVGELYHDLVSTMDKIKKALETHDHALKEGAK